MRLFGFPRRSNELPDGIRPLTAALWLARCQRDYLRGIEGPDYRPWLDALARDDAERALAVGRALVRAWAERARAELGPLDVDRPRAWIERACALVGQALLTPIEMSFAGGRRWFAKAREPYFVEGTASRLIRGLVNCDGHAHLLALVLGGWTRAELIRLDNHRLVRLPRVPGVDEAVLVDGYSELPPFVLGARVKDLATLDEVHARAIERDREHERRGRPPGEPPGSARDYRWASRIWAIEVEPAIAWKQALVSPDFAVGQTSTELEAMYFEARVQHLFGDRDVARALYSKVAGPDDGDRPGVDAMWRSAARRFAARISTSRLS